MSGAKFIVSPDWFDLLVVLGGMVTGFASALLLSPFAVGFLNAVSSAPLLDYLADTSASQKSSVFSSSLHRGAVSASRQSGMKAFLGRFLFYSALIYAGCFELAHQIVRQLFQRLLRLLLRCKLLPYYFLSSNKLLCHFYILFLRGDCQTYFREKVLALLVTYYLI